MKNYSLKVCEDLIQQYVEIDGDIIEIEPGILGLGKMLLIAKGYKFVLITEYYINCWTSGHKIKMYNKIPKKYQHLV